MGIDKGSIPDLTKVGIQHFYCVQNRFFFSVVSKTLLTIFFFIFQAPGSLLEEMENHLTYLEGKKTLPTSTTPK